LAERIATRNRTHRRGLVAYRRRAREGEVIAASVVAATCRQDRRSMVLDAEPWVTILVLNWNGKADTLICLESLAALNYTRCDIVVVDNGSSDGSASAIASRFPQVTVLQTGANLGFAGGNNVGLRHVLTKNADFVLILNNDTQVAPGFLDTLLREAHAQDGRVILGAMTLSISDRSTVQFGGSVWEPSSLHFRWLQGTLQSDMYAADTIESDYIQGSAMLIPIAAIREVGLLDERYYLTYEDTDWCYRARKLGYKLLISTRACVWHKESPSFGGKSAPLYAYFITRNRLLWTRTHMGRRSTIGVAKRIYWTMLADFRDFRLEQASDAGSAPRAISSIFSFVRQPRQIAVMAGIRDYVLRRFGNCPPSIRKLNARKLAATA
jgi:GT2 family glycosyltransferase